jgi:hypothetical protein
MATDHSNIFSLRVNLFFLSCIASLVFASLCIGYVSICIDVSLHDFVCCFHDC